MPNPDSPFHRLVAAERKSAPLAQKSFGDFTKERFGPNWVFAARDTPRLQARYAKQDCPAVIITPKQQRQLAADYKHAWGEEHNPAAWAALCALRAVSKDAAFATLVPETQDAICYAIQGLTL